MKRLFAIALLGSLTASAEEGFRSGHATAQWFVGQNLGESIMTVVRLEVDDGWHVYWHNPGESGMPTSVELKLPEGWAADELQHPVPKNFKTGGLHGFGHEGTVDYVLNLQAPKGFKGDAELEATVSWLTCNDDACIPGEIPLKLKIKEGKAVGPGMDPQVYGAVISRLPLRAEKWEKFSAVELKLQDGNKHWELIIENPEKLELNPAKTKVFIETQELASASAEVKFEKVGELWKAKVPKGEYAPEKPEQCAILLVQEGKRAVRFEWKRD